MFGREKERDERAKRRGDLVSKSWEESQKTQEPSDLSTIIRRIELVDSNKSHTVAVDTLQSLLKGKSR